MACKNSCHVCDRFIATDNITFADGTLIINIPAGDYRNNTKYCIFLNQQFPPETTVAANVVVTIGTGTVQYPLVKRNCRPASPCNLRYHWKYSVCVETSATGGTFRLLGDTSCAPGNQLASINGTAPAAAPATPAVTPTT